MIKEEISIEKILAEEGLQDYLAQPQDGWRLYGPSDFLEDRPPVREIVKNVFAAGSLGMVFGPSGSMKSMLLTDLCVCVAAGLAFLPDEDHGGGFSTRESPVCWYNADNPTRTCHDRFAAFLRGHGIDSDVLDLPLGFWSFPDPLLDASDESHMKQFGERIQAMGARLVIVDCLQVVRGRADENAATEMGSILAGFRRLCDNTGATVILVHHVNKNGNFRGSTSIENLVDWSLSCTRDGDVIKVTPGKMRDAATQPFAARLAFEHREGTRDLHSARMFAAPLESDLAEKECSEAVMEYLAGNGGANQSDISRALAETDMGRREIRQTLEKLESQKRIRSETGKRRAVCYYIC